MPRRTTAFTAIFILIVGLLLGSSFAGAATPNDKNCRKATVVGKVSLKELLAYDACRFDKIDEQLADLAAGSPTTTPPTTTPPTTTPPTTAPPTTTTPKPSPSAPTTAPASTCSSANTIVKFKGQGSADLGQYKQGNYNASAELWNVGGYSYAQTMGVCTHDAWYVDVTTDNSKGDGAVKAYPSMRRIYHDWSTSDFSKDPLVSSFPRLDVTFGSKDPASCPGCIYNTAFDVWLNGIGNGSANELMIWTHNVAQRPFGTKVGSDIKIAGHTWELWSGNSNHYLAFVPTDTSYIESGTFDIKDFTSYLIARDRLPSATRLGQISYGVETVSTGGVSRHWDFTKFTVADS